MNKIYQYFIIIFIVSFICDILLNIAAHNHFISSKLSIIASLRSYFDANNWIICGIYAGLTLVFALFINIIITKIIFNITIPNNYKELSKVLIITFIVGYFLDIAIYKFKVFGNLLDPFYKEAGAGLLGASAFIFAYVCTYVILNYIK
jgi:hypothetical protein